MNTTLADSNISIILPADLLWVDEFDFNFIVQSKEYTLDGSLVFDEAEKLTGREITLEGGTDRSWIEKSVVDKIHAFVVADKKMTLTLADNRVFNVRWNSSGKPFEAKKIFETFPHNDSDLFFVRMKFIEY